MQKWAYFCIIINRKKCVLCCWKCWNTKEFNRQIVCSNHNLNEFCVIHKSGKSSKFPVEWMLLVYLNKLNLKKRGSSEVNLNVPSWAFQKEILIIRWLLSYGKKTLTIFLNAMLHFTMFGYHTNREDKTTENWQNKRGRECHCKAKDTNYSSTYKLMKRSQTHVHFLG